MKDKEFLGLCDEAIEKANDLLKQRANEYGQSDLSIIDYFQCLDNVEQAAFVPVWMKTLRMKSLLNSKIKQKKQKKIDTLLDLINYTRFLYAILTITGPPK